MPNHVTNIINAPSDVLDFLRGQVVLLRWRKGAETRSYPASKDWVEEEYLEDVDCDFGRVIPQPVNINRGDEGFCKAPDGVFPDGRVSWYYWNRANWGTKWNAYGIERNSDTELKFETAWSHPFPVVRALSVKFPAAELHVRYADEDIGSNLGEYWIRDGVILRSTDFGEAGGETACDFACKLCYGTSYAEYLAEMEEGTA